jgi:hypothetical protein
MNHMAAEWGIKEWDFTKSSWKTCKISSLVNCQGDCFGHVMSAKIEQYFVVTKLDAFSESAQIEISF